MSDRLPGFCGAPDFAVHLSLFERLYRPGRELHRI